jgi:hypothetical protein
LFFWAVLVSTPAAQSDKSFCAAFLVNDQLAQRVALGVGRRGLALEQAGNESENGASDLLFTFNGEHAGFASTSKSRFFEFHLTNSFIYRERPE